MQVIMALILYNNSEQRKVICLMYLDTIHLNQMVPMFYIPKGTSALLSLLMRIDTKGFNTTFIEENDRVNIPILSQWNPVYV